MERLYSVVTTLVDGRTKVQAIRAETTGGAFAAAKAMADVRRVGKVAEVTEAAFRAVERGEAPPPESQQQQPATPAHAPRAGGDARRASAGRTSSDAAGQEAAPSDAGPRAPLFFKLAGPRVVIDARRGAGGEQPFRNLPPVRLAPEPPPAPPEPLRPVTVTSAAPIFAKPTTPASTPEPVPTAATAPAPEPAQEDEAPATPGTEYRIVKSRRRDGLPYILQRGTWRQLKGKRAFESDWEKGFANREAAERHLGWLSESEQEIDHAQANHDDGADEGDVDAEEHDHEEHEMVSDSSAVR